MANLSGEGVQAETGTRKRERSADQVTWGMWWISCALLLGISVLVMTTLNTGAPDRLQVFGTYWSSGWAANHGLNPYGVDSLTWKARLHGGSVLDLNLNPPVVLPLLQAFALLQANTAVKVWTIFSWLLFCGGAGLLVRAYGPHLQPRQLIWIMLGAATCETLWIGQIYAVFFFLALAGWILLDRRSDIAAGIAIGLLVAIKPNCGVWPLLLALSGRRKVAGISAIAATAFSLLALAIYGPATYADWFHAIRGQNHWMFPTEVSLIGLASRLNHRVLGEAAAAFLLVFSCLWVHWKRTDARCTSGIALLVSILASPLAWYHYILFAAGPLVRERWGWGLTAIMIPFILPFPFIYWIPASALFWVLLVYFYWESNGQARERAAPVVKSTSM